MEQEPPDEESIDVENADPVDPSETEFPADAEAAAAAAAAAARARACVAAAEHRNRVDDSSSDTCFGSGGRGGGISPEPVTTDPDAGVADAAPALHAL